MLLSLSSSGVTLLAFVTETEKLPMNGFCLFVTLKFIVDLPFLSPEVPDVLSLTSIKSILFLLKIKRSAIG